MSGGGWFDWLPGFLRGPTTPPEAFGPKPPPGLAQYGPHDPASLAGISDSSMQFDDSTGTKGDLSRQLQQAASAFQRYQAARQQPQQRMTEWFGPRRVG